MENLDIANPGRTPLRYRVADKIIELWCRHEERSVDRRLARGDSFESATIADGELRRLAKADVALMIDDIRADIVTSMVQAPGALDVAVEEVHE